jgi:hypothetical protein
MLHAMILICSIYVPPQSCDEHRALDSSIRSVPFGIAGMAGQVETVNTAIGPDEYHYEKVVAFRERGSNLSGR